MVEARRACRVETDLRRALRGGLLCHTVESGSSLHDFVSFLQGGYGLVAPCILLFCTLSMQKQCRIAYKCVCVLNSAVDPVGRAAVMRTARKMPMRVVAIGNGSRRGRLNLSPKSADNSLSLFRSMCIIYSAASVDLRNNIWLGSLRGKLLMPFQHGSESGKQSLA